MRSKTSIVSSFSFFLSSYFFHTEAAGGSCGFCISARPNCKGSPPMRCKGGGIPRPLVCNSRVVKIDAATDGTEQRLPLEGKLAQRQLRLMRSKLKIITMGWYKIATFDLIRSGLSRTTFPSRGRLFSPRRFLRMKFVRIGACRRHT